MSDSTRPPPGEVCRQPPIYPVSTKTVDPPAAGTIDFAVLITPPALEGYRAVLARCTLTATNTIATPNLYNDAIAPEWLIAFVDPANENLPRQDGEFDPAAALRNPFDADIPFFELAATFGIVQVTNGGRGFGFPFYSYSRHWPVLISARGIGTTCRIGITPAIEYERI